MDRKVHGFESDRSHVTKLPRNDHWAQLRRTLLWWGLGLGISVLLMLAVLLGWL